jgi:hypothetical protein
VIAVIPHRARRSNEIVYAARGLEAHADVGHLIVIGDRPQGITPDEYWPSSNADSPHTNVNRHLRLAAERLPEFCWHHDDTFLLALWVPGVYVRRYSIAKHLSDFPRIRGYSELVRASIQAMRTEGYDPALVPCGAIHRPWLIQSARALATLDRLAPDGHFMSLYVAGLENVIPIGEAKIKTLAVPREDADCISTEPRSWAGPAGKMIRRKLSEPSRWETI